MKSFDEYLQFRESSRTGPGKTGLYPLLYQGVSQYPLQDILTHSADAITYLVQDDRIYSNGDRSPHSIEHIPGKPNPNTENPNNGDGEPHSIDHIPGPKSHHTMNNNIIKFNYKIPENLKMNGFKVFMEQDPLPNLGSPANLPGGSPGLPGGASPLNPSMPPGGGGMMGGPMGGGSPMSPMGMGGGMGMGAPPQSPTLQLQPLNVWTTLKKILHGEHIKTPKDVKQTGQNPPPQVNSAPFGPQQQAMPPQQTQVAGQMPAGNGQIG